jgi:hypothetical protein
MVALGKKPVGYFLLLFSRYLPTVDYYRASGHHHDNCQKNMHISESSGKSRRTRLSKNSFHCSSDGVAGHVIGWVLPADVFLLLDYYRPLQSFWPPPRQLSEKRAHIRE